MNIQKLRGMVLNREKTINRLCKRYGIRHTHTTDDRGNIRDIFYIGSVQILSLHRDPMIIRTKDYNDFPDINGIEHIHKHVRQFISALDRIDRTVKKGFDNEEKRKKGKETQIVLSVIKNLKKI